MSIVLTVSASRLIGTTGDGEMAGDLKRIYNATPVTAKAVRLIGTVGVDEYAADIVKEIFAWKIEGFSLNAIAKKLNRRHEQSPKEYKHRILEEK